jgi:hypothetical protein
MKRPVPLTITQILIICLLLGGCAQDHNETEKKLVSFVKEVGFEVPLVFLEQQGQFYSGNWYKVALYFGYAYDGNWRNCQEEADRLNKVSASIKFRCNGTF